MKRKYFIPGAYILLVAAIAYLQLWWLLAGILGAAPVFGILVWKRSALEKIKVYYLLVFFLVFVFSILVRVFLFEIYSIPSSSMENTLFPGDKIIVSKLKYGPKMPGSPFEIPWINLFFYLNAHARERIDEPWWDGKRLNGTKKVERGDVVVFKFPDDKTEHFIKRCIALPGDTLRIINGLIYIGGRHEADPMGIKLRYDVWYADRKKTVDLLDSLGIYFYPAFDRGKDRFFEASLTSGEATCIKRSAFIDSVAVMVTPADTVPSVYPWNRKFPWTAENFGPLIIPGKRMRMTLTGDNFALYRKTLYKFECESLLAKEIEVQLEVTGHVDYIFKKNYYFMMGDNRYGSNDSRFWGLVPEDYIVGNAVIVLFSTDINKAAARILKTIE